jgi:HEAT repeat protein
MNTSRLRDEPTSETPRAARAIATLINRRLLTLDPAQVLHISTSLPFRELAVTAWLHSHDPAPERGEQFARDPARSVRLAVAEALPRLGSVAPGVVEALLARLRQDPSARVRRTVSENSNRAA